MQNVLKRVLSCGMALLMCLGITTAVRTVVSVTDYTVADAATSADYYADISATKGTQLLGELHDLIVSTHKRYTSYDDCRTYGPKTDPGLDGRGALEFYTHETVMSFNGTVGTWNREHVWCKSLSGGLWGTTYGGSDLHHIRPSEGGLNSTRGSNKYGEVTGGKEAWSRKVGGANSMLGGHVGGGVFEPLDNVKGDAARIVMYVYTHYNSAGNVGGTVNSKGSGTLKFNYVMAPSSESDAIKLLLEWNRLDPVDEIERYRNEEVYKIQGNRNPFIDNSSYADAIWGDGSVVDPPAPDKAKLTVTPSSLTLKEGQSQKLTVTFNPASATSSVNWNSDNPAVASVSSLGTVTANAEGTAKIYAVSASDSSVKNYATVTVTKDGGGTVTPPTPANSATITADSFSLSGSYGFHSWQEGGVSGTAFIYGGNSSSMQFNSSKASQYIASTTSATSGITSVEVKLNSKTTANKNWKLLTSNTPYGEVAGKPTDGNDQGVKAVTQEGVIWTLNGNDKYFTLNYEDTGACYLESVTVTFGGNGGGDPVLPPDPPLTELEGIEIAPSTVNLDIGQTKNLTVLPDPLNAKADVNWATSDSAVATVSNGTVTAKGAGTATITATDKNNPAITATATVTVSNVVVAPSDKVTVTLSSFTLTDNYGFKQWSQDGFGGIGYIFGGSASYPADKIQLSQKQASCYIASSVSAGNIKSITITNPNKFSAEWTLLTSDTPYGEVAGVPDTGTNRGVKTVEANGTATWTLDGTDKYFTLNAKPDPNGYAVYLESIVIEYGEDQGGTEPEPPVNEKLVAFHNAVMAIDDNGTIEQREEQIVYAESIYDTLTSDEKAEALDDIAILAAARQKLEQDKNGGTVEPDVDQAKLDNFYAIVAELVDNENGPLEERKAAIDEAYAIADTFTADERKAAAEKIAELDAAYKKYQEDLENGGNIPDGETSNIKAFKTAVASIPSSGSAETRFNAIKNAIQAYNKLTDGEKSKVTAEKATLDAAVTAYNEMINSYNSSAGVSSDIAVGAMKNFFEHVHAFLAVLVKIR